ncbi:lipopolysaccharide biosynthesis protein [uncultured Desulfuromusa sp.]|uniref:lipopolysaccharide biosynthesis protein n=1 Tax=uncultured Desulfuromusa sp. TaxID=219183 RepID=UPI002AA7C831|nr:lipopolysaccharide biosynthesis protein [uncultured Desulfuromusa sp.]
MSHQTSIFKGAILTVTLRWTDRLIGFVSTLILARLLLPDDFGVVAMASMVILLADVFLNLGVNVALIQNHNATQDHYNTAWTLRLSQTILSCLIVSLFAPFAGQYFDDLRVVPVIQLISIHLVLNGMENIGVINFQKQMLFAHDFRFRLSKRLFGFVVTIVAAYFLRNYWALVIGTLAGSGLGVILSYLMHPMRPKFSFVKIKEIFSVSQWMLVNSIGQYFNNNAHKILVGRTNSTSVMGGYSLSDEIALMPTGELLSPINRVLFPAFSAVKTNLIELKKMYLLAQGVQTLIAIPASVGLMLVAHEAVYVLLGENWLFAVPFLKILVLANIFQAIITSGHYMIITLGYFRYAAMVTWFQVFIFIVLFITSNTSAAYEIATIRILSILIGFSLLIWLVMRVLPDLKLYEIIRTVIRPIIASLIMFFVVTGLNDYLTFNLEIVLFLKIFIGALVYFFSVLSFWILSGKPDGSEKYILKKVFLQK